MTILYRTRLFDEISNIFNQQTNACSSIFLFEKTIMDDLFEKNHCLNNCAPYQNMKSLKETIIQRMIALFLIIAIEYQMP